MNTEYTKLLVENGELLTMRTKPVEFEYIPKTGVSGNNYRYRVSRNSMKDVLMKNFNVNNRNMSVNRYIPMTLMKKGFIYLFSFFMV